MEQNSASIWKSSLTFGVYLGIVLILVSVVYYVSGNTFSPSTQWVMYLLMAVGVVLSQIAYRKSLGGYMTYGQALGIGLLTVVFASVLTAIYNYLMFHVIDPSLQEQLRLATEEQLVKKRIPEEQMEAALQMAARLQSPVMMFIMAIFGGAIVGLIISLITAIFTQKKPSEVIE